MNKYILIAFAVMAVSFYELSGGADFEPGDTSLVVFATPKPVAPTPDPQPPVVARADTSNTDLTDVVPTRAIIQPVGVDAQSGTTPSRTEPAVETAAVVQEPVQVVAPAPEPEVQPDFRFVDGDRVNLRGGPGTDYAVVGKLLRNDMVEVLKDEGNGWLHLRVRATGDEGWMADWLLTAAN